MAVLELHRAGLTGRLQPLDLRINDGEATVLLGRSGAGKTSLIGLCNGSLLADQGQVLWQGQPLRRCRGALRRQIGTLWQDLRLVEELTVLQNINSGALGRHSLFWGLRNLINPPDQSIGRQVMARVGLPPSFLHQPVSTLSGGERQRVALARLLRQQPALVLADEPLSALDPRLAEDVLNLLLAQRGCLISLHRPDLMHRFQRVLGVRQGALVLDAAPSAITTEALAWLYSDD
ncbi:MAG: ATP-binding cassette domain-containing protein [Synechococcus sp. BS307-5m-G38]|nr:ATP-binding cassette domain-containing protein [Synechococcus sp. BS307-5m-G38]